MGFPTAGKIWMNGSFVKWDDAKVHVLTHTLHYGTGVFEEIKFMVTDTQGARDTARVLRISPTTVIAVLKKSRRASLRQPRVADPSSFTRPPRPGRTRRRAR